jgi:hypothetical protein
LPNFPSESRARVKYILVALVVWGVRDRGRRATVESFLEQLIVQSLEQTIFWASKGELNPIY